LCVDVMTAMDVETAAGLVADVARSETQPCSTTTGSAPTATLN